MPLYTKAQFAEKYGKSRAAVTSSIKRNTLVASGDYIDDEHPLNAAKARRWALELQNKKPNPKGKKTVAEPKVESNTKLKNIDEPKVFDDFDDNSLESQKKRAEIALKIEQLEGHRLKNQKLRGESIPTDMVRKVVMMLGHSFQSNYKNSSEVFLLDICHRLKAPAKIEAELKGQLIQMINNSHENAINEAKKQLKSIIEQNTVALINSDEDE